MDPNFKNYIIMKLELKHLALYLPYGLKGEVNNHEYNEKHIDELDTISFFDKVLTFRNEACDVYLENSEFGTFKPILRPLSDLLKGSFPHELIRFLIDEKIYKNSFAKGHEKYSWKLIHKPFGGVIKFTNHDEWVLYISINEPDRIKHKIFVWLLENHFDVFGLIEKGLAIDKNNLIN